MNETVRSLVAGAAGAVVTLALVVGQPALAHEADQVKAKKVTSTMIKNGTIAPVDLDSQVQASLAKADSALQGVPANSVGTAQLVDGSMTNPKLANGSVTGAKVAGGTLISGNLADGSVTTTKIADGSVTTTKIADGSVTGPKVAAGAIGSTQVADGAVTGPKVAAGAIGSAQVADGTLKAKDIALETGTLVADVPSLTTNQCAAFIAIIETDHDLTGDLILVSNPIGVAGAVQLSARQNASNSFAFDLIACDVGGPVNPPSATFTWVVIGT